MLVLSLLAAVVIPSSLVPRADLAPFSAQAFDDPFGQPTEPVYQPVSPPVYLPVPTPVPPSRPRLVPPPVESRAARTSTTPVTVAGCFDVPGIGRVCINPGQNQALSPDDARARAAIHTLAVDAEQRTNDVFDDYSRARDALLAIDRIASEYGSDPICHAISVMAERTLGQTRSDWDPFGQDKLFRSVDTIAQLSQ